MAFTSPHVFIYSRGLHRQNLDPLLGMRLGYTAQLGLSLHLLCVSRYCHLVVGCWNIWVLEHIMGCGVKGHEILDALRYYYRHCFSEMSDFFWTGKVPHDS